MMLGKGLENHDNFDTFRHFYLRVQNTQNSWARRSDSQCNWVHLLGEQATVQWALEVEDTHLAELATIFIRLQCRETNHPEQIPELLKQVATANKDGSFSRCAILALEDLCSRTSDSPVAKKRRRVTLSPNESESEVQGLG